MASNNVDTDVSFVIFEGLLDNRGTYEGCVITTLKIYLNTE